ncbi:MAG: hypothetical protein RI897_770 [Verrucomicrobiota bacterium]
MGLIRASMGQVERTCRTSQCGLLEHSSVWTSLLHTRQISALLQKTLAHVGMRWGGAGGFVEQGEAMVVRRAGV